MRAAATLEEKREKALKGGGEKRIVKQHKTVSFGAGDWWSSKPIAPNRAS